MLPERLASHNRVVSVMSAGSMIVIGAAWPMWLFRTLPLAIQFLVSDQYQDIGMLATGLMIATLPVLVLYLFLSEWFVKGMTAGAIKG